MKTLSFLLLWAIVACSSGNKNENAATPPASGATAPASTEGRPCTEEGTVVCPDGQIDACEKALAEAAAKPDAGDSGGTGTMMALEEGRMGVLGRAGNHRCVAR